MKKEYHGVWIEKFDISSEAIITSSVGGCAYTYDYNSEHVTFGSNEHDYCQNQMNPPPTRPYYYSQNG